MKKRGNTVKVAEGDEGYTANQNNVRKNTGAIILIAVLMVAILAVAGYIALRYFIPNDFLYEGIGVENQVADPTEPAATEEAIQDTEPVTESLACTAVLFDSTSVLIDGIGNTFQLSVNLEPANTVDPVFYTSSDNTVAVVSEDGTITAVGEGTAVITINCGTASAECTVICTDPTAFELSMNRKKITFNAEGQSWQLYDGDVAAEEIIWFSDDSEVATIENGVVVAVANGETVVYGMYEEQTVSCEIICAFEEVELEGTENVEEATIDPNKKYALYNPYGYATDVTIKTGESFTLLLVDSNLKEAPNAKWSVSDPSVCSYENGIVTGLKSGLTEITVTCNGKTYTSVIRVL